MLSQKDLVFLAGGSRRLDELLKDPQAHESDVFHHDRCLYIHGHEEQTEGCQDRKAAKVEEFSIRNYFVDELGLGRDEGSFLPHRNRNSQHPPSFEIESVSSNISYCRLLTC